MKKVKRVNKIVKAKISALLLLFIVIVVTTVLFMYSDLSNTINTTFDNSISNSKDERFNSIEIFLNEISSKANGTVVTVTDEIQNSILLHYSDNLEALKNQLNQKDYSVLASIIDPCIRNKFLNGIKTNGNTIFVANIEGIISDYSYSDSQYAIDEKNTFRTWEQYINSSKNPDLALTAYENIVKNHESSLVIWESSTSKAHTKYSYIDMDTLREIYKEYGLEELKNYEILVPKYITETGDIFGTLDIMQGIKQKNYKFIVIQRYNIYDQLMNSYKSYLNIDETEVLTTNYIVIISRMYIMGILLVIGLISIIVAMSMMFNHLYYCGKEDFIIEENYFNNNSI